MSDLVTLTIDGIEVTVPSGTLVVDAAKKIGVEIPVFCYHPKLEPVGMCRMCLVSIGRPARDRATGELILEEDGSPKINFWSGLETGCTIPVSEGMVVITNSEPVEEARETIIEFLLTSHPLDCPICDKGGECPLQNLTMAYGDGQTRMIYSDKLKLDKHVPLGDLIYLDRERCIQCARCVRFQDEIVDDPVLAFHNRGRRLEIVTMSEPGFDSYWSGNTTDICPVGALTTADFRFGARPWELNPVSTISVHGPAGSNMTFSTRREAKSGGRSVIKRVLPRQNELVNEIWISDRDRFVYHFAEAGDRLQTPLIRRNGSLEPASWDEALDLVASKLEEHKNSAAGLAGDRLSNEDLYLFQKLFRSGLKSNHIDLANRRLGGGEVVAKVGFTSSEDASPPARLGSDDAVLVVATDLHEEEPIWWLRVKQAVEQGAKLVVLNLRPTRLDKFAAVCLHYQPGQALSTVQQLLTAAKVETDSDDPVVMAANLLVEANNLVVFYGYEGLGYSETETLAQLLGNLLLLKNGAGDDHYGRENNGLIPVWPHNNTQGAWDMGIHPALLPGYKSASDPGMNAQEIYKAIREGDLRALYVLGTDPIGDGLMAGRGKLGFLVVQELFMTETAAAADVVLPAQSWAERDGTFTSGERRVQRYYPAIQPVGQSRPDWQILGQISERVGVGKAPIAAGQIFTELAKATPQYKGMNYRSLAQVTPQWPIIDEHDDSYGGNVVANRSGLGQQWPISKAGTGVSSGEQFEVGDQAAPVMFETLRIARIAALFTSGTLLDRSEVISPRIARPTLIINQDDAADHGLTEGDHASILINGREYRTAVAVVDSFGPGLALMRGVPYFSGLVEAKIDKFEIVEKELVV
jgi:NADH-quinone oxidoreductase subunit G